MAVVVDGASVGSATLFVDGEAVDEATNLMSSSFGAANMQLIVGDGFAGSIDEPSLWVTTFDAVSVAERLMVQRVAPTIAPGTLVAGVSGWVGLREDAVGMGARCWPVLVRVPLWLLTRSLCCVLLRADAAAVRRAQMSFDDVLGYVATCVSSSPSAATCDGNLGDGDFSKMPTWSVASSVTDQQQPTFARSWVSEDSVDGVRVSLDFSHESTTEIEGGFIMMSVPRYGKLYAVDSSAGAGTSGSRGAEVERNERWRRLVEPVRQWVSVRFNPIPTAPTLSLS